jgi:succinate---hydroxymethylglutarate CoA-transferase
MFISTSGRLLKRSIGARSVLSTRFGLPRFQTSDVTDGIPPPLLGLRVLDLTRILAGPTATMLLADLGADVVKVEEVSKGDDTREYIYHRRGVSLVFSASIGSWTPPSAPLISKIPAESSHLPPESAYFLAVNRNKRSITVNFRTCEGRDIIERLVKKSDVLVENFVSGKLASMGLGWEACKKINPRLIYTSITGGSPFCR